MKTSAFRVDVTFVGLRNWLNITGKPLGRYKLGISFGDLWLKSGLSSKAYGHSVNLLDPFQSGYVDLPEQLDYWPTIFIKHIDCSARNENVIGSATLTQSIRYLVDHKRRLTNPSQPYPESNSNQNYTSEQQPLLESTVQSSIIKMKSHSKMTNRMMQRLSRLFKRRLHPFAYRTDTPNDANPTVSTQRMLSSISGFTWWTKYYNSIKYSSDYDCTQKHRLRIYDAELEQQAEFGWLRDWADSVDLQKVPDKFTRNRQRKKKIYAQLKIDIQVRRCSDSLKCYSLNK